MGVKLGSLMMWRVRQLYTGSSWERMWVVLVHNPSNLQGSPGMVVVEIR